MRCEGNRRLSYTHPVKWNRSARWRAAATHGDVVQGGPGTQRAGQAQAKAA